MTAETVQSEGLDPGPRRGEIRVLNGQVCRFIECELEGDKWEVLGPAEAAVWKAGQSGAQQDAPTDAFHLACPSCGQAIDLIPADSVRNPTPSDHPDLAELVRRFLTPIPTKDGCALISIPALQFRFEEVIAPLLHRVETAERELAEARETVGRLQGAWSEVDRLAAANQAMFTRATEAQATITRLQAQLARAREALGPFAAALKKYEADCFFATREASIIVPDEVPVLLPGYEEETDAARFTIGDIRRASEVFTSLSEKGARDE